MYQVTQICRHLPEKTSNSLAGQSARSGVKTGPATESDVPVPSLLDLTSQSRARASVLLA